MEYRTTSPADNGYESEVDEDEHLRAFIQHLMTTSGPGDLLDSILVVVNVCEIRAMLNAHNQPVADWYHATAAIFRNVLDVMCNASAKYKPLAKLENNEFYFPDTGITH